MNEKKFDVVSIIISAVAMLLSLFCFSVESIAAAVVSLVLSIRRKEKYRTGIAVVFSVIAIIGSIAFLAFMFYLSLKTGHSASDYWLIQLFFGKMNK